MTNAPRKRPKGLKCPPAPPPPPPKKNGDTNGRLRKPTIHK